MPLPYSLAEASRPLCTEGIQFLWDAVMGRRGPLGRGAILADDMGLGKTLMTIATIWTLLRQSPQGRGEIKHAIIACPTSLVGK
jgi:SNF2 family DNA or RNA helicase